MGYFGHPILENVNAAFEPGLNFIIGPNGSGKSTLLRTIVGVLKPIRGDVLLDGVSVFRNPRVKKLIGYFPHGVGLLPNLTVRKNLILYGELIGLERNLVRSRIEEISSLFKLDDLLDKRVSELSHGQRVRVGIARALLHDPEVLVLDEPFTGLDPHFSRELQNILVRLAEHKVIIITTHLISHIQECPHRKVLLIGKGKILFEGKFSELVSRVGLVRRYILKLQGSDDAILRIFRKFDLKFSKKDEYWIIDIYGEAFDTTSLLRELIDNGIVVSEIKEDQEYVIEYVIERLAG